MYLEIEWIRLSIRWGKTSKQGWVRGVLPDSERNLQRPQSRRKVETNFISLPQESRFIRAKCIKPQEESKTKSRGIAKSKFCGTVPGCSSSVPVCLSDSSVLPIASPNRNSSVSRPVEDWACSNATASESLTDLCLHWNMTFGNKKSFRWGVGSHALYSIVFRRFCRFTE